MPSGPYLDDIAKLVDAGKVCATHCIARVFLIILVTCPPSLVHGNSPEVGLTNIHASLHSSMFRLVSVLQFWFYLHGTHRHKLLNLKKSVHCLVQSHWFIDEEAGPERLYDFPKDTWLVISRAGIYSWATNILVMVSRRRDHEGSLHKVG